MYGGLFDVLGHARDKRLVVLEVRVEIGLEHQRYTLKHSWQITFVLKQSNRPKKKVNVSAIASEIRALWIDPSGLHKVNFMEEELT